MIKLLNQSRARLEPSKWAHRYGTRLQRFARLRLGNIDAAEEVVQETFLAGLNNQHQYAGSGTEHAWLTGILKRKIVDYVRRKRTMPIVSDQLPADEPGASRMDFGRFGHQQIDDSPSAGMERREFWSTVEAQLNTLPRRYASALRLKEIEGWSTEEVCARLNISQSNLYVMIHRARARLNRSREVRTAMLN